MKLTVWQRLRRARHLLRGTRWTVKRIHRKPNAPSPVLPHRPPTKQPGEGLSGWQKHLHTVMVATLGNPYGWTYNEVRPLYLPKRRLTVTELATFAGVKKGLGLLVSRYRSDCSFGAKTLFWLIGAKDDPTGTNWGPWGNSSSIYAHLPKRFGLNNAYHPASADLARCEVGDILVVGLNGGEHVAVILEKGPNPLVWSDGHNGAPDSYHVLDDARRPISVCVPKGLDG